MTDEPTVTSPSEDEVAETPKKRHHRVLEEGGPLDHTVRDLLEDLKAGHDDADNRRQVEEWLRALSDKYPEFEIELGLRDYYLAEAKRLREAFTSTRELQERLALGRSIETYLEKAADIDRRLG